jgi:hypothetical protein
MRAPIPSPVIVCCAALLVAACGSSGGSAGSVPDTVATDPAASPAATAIATAPAAGDAAATPALGDWPLFGLRPSRENATDRSTGITTTSVRRLRRVQVRLPGTVDSSPIVLLGVRVAGATRDVAFLTTTYGRTLAVDLARHRILWTFTPSAYDAVKGTPQITNASPAADPDRRYVYTASSDGLVHKLSVADGREAPGAWPVRVTRDPTHEKLTSSFNVSGTRLIVATGGYIGDAPPYQGHVVSIERATGRVAAVFNSLCSDRREIIQPSSCPSSDSAIWARSGAVVLPGGDLLVATGNAPFDGRVDWGDSVLRLDGDTLAVKQNWTPANQEQLEASDGDLGSTAPAVLGGGLVLQGGKDAKLDLLDTTRLNGSGGASARLGGQLQTLATPGGDGVFSAPAVWHHSGRTLVFVTTGSGTTAYRLTGRRLAAVWANQRAGTSPVLAGGVLYVHDPTGGGLLAYAPATGRVLATMPAGAGHWGSPVVTGGRIVLPEGNANDYATTGVLDVYERR